MFLSLKDAWEAGKSHETAWWLNHLRSSFNKADREPHHEAAIKGTKAFGFDRFIEHAPPEQPISVLDIGAGPITQIGPNHPSRRIEITAVDPLADDYDRIFGEIGEHPVVRTIKGEAETLANQFPADTFDFAYCRNALDHSYDPLTGISHIMRVLKPGCVFYLIGHTNEAHGGNYVGLHQWNIEVRGERPFLWRPGVQIDIAEALSKEADLVAANGDNWYMITLRKPSSN
jgi:SAM-dependent methyltransferase